jgi:predicted Zn-dependent protease
VSERERLYIESHYYAYVTGDLAKAAGVFQTWSKTYPADSVPQTDLTVIDTDLGKFGPNLESAQAALRLAPDDAQNYGNLTNAYILAERLSDAQATIQEAMARKFDTSDLHLYLYDLAFLRNDAAGMQQQMTWAAGEPGIEDIFLGHYADSLAFAGQEGKAREFTDRATEAAKRAGEMETAAGYEVDAAQREALFGNSTQARRLAEAALALAHDRDTKYGVAVALALSGSLDRANALADELNKDFPDDTLAQFVYLPAIRGAVAIQQKDSARAISLLDAATPFEIGVSGGLFPVYIRGLAFLAEGDGRRAQIEFEKVVAHPGVLLSSPLGPLARLQLARAYALEGAQAQAKSAYADFLAKWKDADPDIPILQAAKAESMKQQ